MATRFASVTEEELDLLVQGKDSKNTKRATRASAKIFNDYLKEKRLKKPEDKTSLATILKSFYVEARKSDGTLYSKSSLYSLRFGLKRHFKASEGTDIIHDPVFYEANNVFLAKCVDLKRRGLAKVDHRPAIVENDLRKLYESGVFNLDHPKTLQNKVFFEIVFYFCRRGRRSLRELKINDLSFSFDDKGSRYVKRTGDEFDLKNRDDNGFEGGVMYEKPGPNCPVASLELYIKHLNPSNKFLFQRPKKHAKIGVDEVCYENMAVGEHSLGEKMKDISREAKLSKIYTNHSIKATSVTALDRLCFEARHMTVIGRQTDIHSRNVSDTIMPASTDSEAKVVKELELEVKKKELQKKEVELQKLIKAVEAKSIQQKATMQQQKGVKPEAQSPQKLQVKVVGPASSRQQSTPTQKKYIMHQPNGQVILTPVSSQAHQSIPSPAVTNNKTPTTALAGTSPVKQVVRKTTTSTPVVQNSQQTGLRIVKVITHGTPVTSNTKPIVASTSTTINKGSRVTKVEGAIASKVPGWNVPKVGGPPVMLQVNTKAEAKQVANLPTMVPVTAVVVNQTPKVVSVQSLATTGQVNSVSKPVQSSQPAQVEPQGSSSYIPLESLIEVNKHAAESSISPVSAVMPDNNTPPMTSPTLGRKDITINDRYRYIAPSGKTPISSHPATNAPVPQAVVAQQVKIETPSIAPQITIKTEPQSSPASANVSALKRPNNNIDIASEPTKKQKSDSAVIIIDPPSPPTSQSKSIDIKPEISNNTTNQPQAGTSTQDVDTSIPNKDLNIPNMDVLNEPKVEPIVNKNIPNIDRNIVDKVKEMNPQQQFQALLSRTQQLYDLRANVCKLLRVLVPELEVDDRRESFEDQTVDELLNQVLEQAETSEPDSKP